MLARTPRIFIGSTTFRINAIACARCRRAVIQEICAVDGVESVTVESGSETVTVTATRPVDRAEIGAVLDKAGYSLVP
jgi:copper chaperone CopZ